MIQKRSVVIMGHATSLSLEPEFWDALQGLAQRQKVSVASLIQAVDKKRHGNLSGAVRVFILKTLQEIIQNEQSENNPVSGKNTK